PSRPRAATLDIAMLTTRARDGASNFPAQRARNDLSGRKSTGLYAALPVSRMITSPTSAATPRLLRRRARADHPLRRAAARHGPRPDRRRALGSARVPRQGGLAVSGMPYVGTQLR